MKDLYNEKYTKRTEIKEDTRIWKGLPCSWINRIDILKMTILLKAMHRFKAVSINIPMTLFTE
jgi:hypothetical protein